MTAEQDALQLPVGWPDGPLDEVLGELLKAAFASCCPSESTVAESDSPACTRMSGSFDLRQVGVAIAPHIRTLIGREVTVQAGEWVHTAADVAAANPGVDYTSVPPGTIARMRAEKAGPSPSFREAIARARQRRENPNG